MVIEALLTAGAFAVSGVGTQFLRRYALRWQVIDVPNLRSSHNEPTPRGGGVAIVLTFLFGLVVLHRLGDIPTNLFIALVVGGVAVAGIGFLDDHGHVPAGLRALVHLAAAGWALFWLNGMPPLDLGFASWSWGWLGNIVGAVGLMWLINLYNFMDGIDGIAAAEAIFVAVAALLLFGVQSNLGWTLPLLIGSTAGFLIFNWPPARIFMGDAGSGFLGYVLGTFVLFSAKENPASLWSWLILLAVFLVDASVTLVRRVATGARWYAAHRSHAYQQVSRRLNSHRAVTLSVLMINLIWLTPFAYVASRLPSLAFWLACIAFIPLIGLVIWLGAGSDGPLPE
jgi:glycosyltransferase WbpL